MTHTAIIAVRLKSQADYECIEDNIASFEEIPANEPWPVSIASMPDSFERMRKRINERLLVDKFKQRPYDSSVQLAADMIAFATLHIKEFERWVDEQQAKDDPKIITTGLRNNG